MPDQHDHLPDSRAAFPTTAWTQIRQAQAMPEHQRRELLCRLASRYWNPLYAYYRSKGQTPHDAEDLVQGLLWHLVSGDRIIEVQPKTKFRHWLMACARNYLLDQQRKAAAARRRPQGGLRSLEDLGASKARRFEPPAGENPDSAYREAWRRTVLDYAFHEVEEICRREDRMTDFQVYLAYYVDAEPRTTWKDIAAQFQLDRWNEASRKGDWVKGRLAKTIRSYIRQYVDSDEEVEDEIRDLLG
jgi:RNA polymerase sigma factor (sigma-70 family)